MIHTVINKSIGNDFTIGLSIMIKGINKMKKVIKLMLGVVGATSVGLFKGESVACADDSLPQIGEAVFEIGQSKHDRSHEYDGLCFVLPNVSMGRYWCE